VETRPIVRMLLPSTFTIVPLVRSGSNNPSRRSP
jgi:hypothetical protein